MAVIVCVKLGALIFSEYSSVFLKWLLSTVVLCPVDEPQDLLEHYKLLHVG